MPSLLRGFSAPVTIDFPYGPDELAFLAAHDSDAVGPLGRGAAQLRQCDAFDLARAARAGAEVQLPETLRTIASVLLADHGSDPALLALALTPPDPAYVAALEPEARRRRRGRRRARS